MDSEIFGKLRNRAAKATVQVECDMLCPHCGAFSPAQGVALPQNYYVVTCYRCKESVMMMVDGDKIIDYYPKQKVTVDAFVPGEISRDYLEAQRCFSVAAWQGCCVMARRCMHLIVEKFEAVGSDLYKQIEDLKTRQLITPVLADAAQRVRALGKHGAHPYDGKGNAFNELDLEDARSALEFCQFLFDQLFIQPKKIEASKDKIR
ncbi:MAG: DUF4145 domain-containing protein [Pyrinomonadaceae bacterium]